MTGNRHVIFWVAGAVLTVAALYVLRSVMLPFVAGMAVAYFLDPVADRLERWGASRTMATTIITLGFIVAIVLAIVLVVPLLMDQIGTLVARVPDYVTALVRKVQPIVARATDSLPAGEQGRLAEAATSVVGGLMSATGKVAAGLWSGGMALVGLVSLVFITPVVTFYMLRDWDRMVAVVDGWLPRSQADTIRELMKEIDRTIAGFVRGQATVCLILGAFYGVGLTLIGIDVGLIVGFVSGLLSFIPYLGSISGFAMSMGLALAQFDRWLPIGLTAAVFFIGQFVEGNFLAPKLVGERVGLHPVWVMFALLAGGALFGFVGVLLAVPVAAAIGVLARFGVRHYLDSQLFHGPAPEASAVPMELAEAKRQPDGAGS